MTGFASTRRSWASCCWRWLQVRSLRIAAVRGDHRTASVPLDRRTTALLVVAVAMAVVSLGYLVGMVPVVIGLFLFGLGMGAWDVGMNVQGALAERRLGRAIMPRFHAGFSVGTVAGALIGAGMVALQVPVPVHLLGVAVLVGVGVPFAVRGFLAGRRRTGQVRRPR